MLPTVTAAMTARRLTAFPAFVPSRLPLRSFLPPFSASANRINLAAATHRLFSESIPRRVPESVPRASKPKKKGVRSVGLLNKDHTEKPMKLLTQRATAFSTAENYNFGQLLSVLQEKYHLMPYIADDVYHIRMPQQISDAEVDSNEVGHRDSEAFFFNNGVLVTWGASDPQIEELLVVANKVGESLYKDLEVEWYDYVVDPEHAGGIVNDTIVIGSDLPQDQYKLAFSSGLARSAKLASLENLLDAHLDKNREIPDLLLLGKKLPLGRSTILKSLGELFSLRGHVNLHSELLDLPDFCWSSSKMEDAFSEISRNLDVRARIAIFNKKLDYANELAEVLRNHLHEEHSLKLEWCIIILISVEIAFEVVHFIDRWREQIAEEEADAAAALALEREKQLVVDSQAVEIVEMDDKQ
ncbi:hypothetical protein BJ741DRAFT_625912 [Chytriomyces cf. hyalinus JEL632]|nr:hypothetical protein BJ741DRAFT_625912 [Chytriomyces cf. hyalinus JEL632]